MEFTPEDFKRMMFPVYSADMKEPFTSQFPELNLYAEFKKDLPNLEKNKILKYIFYVYDKNSPYRIKYNDIMQRKVRAMVDAGYPMEGKEFAPDVDDVLHGKHHKVVDMIIAFLKLHNDNAYTHLVLIEALYYQKVRDVFLGGAEKVKELNEIKLSLRQAQEEVLMGDQSKETVKALNKYLNQDKLNISPEDIARSLNEKGLEETIKQLD